MKKVLSFLCLATAVGIGAAAHAADYPTMTFDATYDLSGSSTGKGTMRMVCDGKGHMLTAELSGEVQMHPVHLAREFHRYFGTTIGQFRRKCRIDFACERLTHSKLPIVEIALESGFTQQPHFTNVFRKITGLTPFQYRKLYDRKSAARP